MVDIGNDANLLLLHLARGECIGSRAALEDLPLWIERYAELLGCDCREGAVAAAIEQLQERLQQLELTCSRQAATIVRTKRLVANMEHGNGRASE